MDIDGKLIDSIESADLSPLVADLSEVAIDSLLEDGTLRKIPVIGWMFNMISAAGSVQNQLFARKLLRFLFAFNDVPVADRRRQIAKLVVDQHYRQELGETLLLLLERMNNLKKPEMLARVFRAYLEERISRNQFDSLGHTIDALNLACVSALKRFYERAEPLVSFGPSLDFLAGDMRVDPDEQHLAMCGLISFQFNSPTMDGNAGTEFVKNDLGRLFISVVLAPPATK